MRTLLLLVALVGCVDEEPKPREVPTCESLGCAGDIACNRLGECVCDGMECAPCQFTDAGVCAP